MANDSLIPEVPNGIESMYSRGTNSQNSPLNGTFVPGMHAKAPMNSSTAIPSTVATAPSLDREQAVVGFLYSVSRKGIGEYWPLHLGSNTIGRSDSCSIQLKEQTVSEKHAVINIKKLKTTDVLIASVRDEGSKNGMFLNDEELDYDNHTCKNGDIITVGSNYQLLLILINASQYGLKVSEDFQAIEEAPKPAKNSSSVYAPKPKHRDDGGTVDLAGNSPFFNDTNKTQFLEH